MNYTVYDPITGEILKNISCSDPDLLAANLGSQTYVNGWYDSNTHYVLDGEPVEKPPKPFAPWLVYVWNANSRLWQIDPDQSAAKSRLYRNTLLSDIDRVNPVWYASLTPEQQQELQAYRQALLAVPQQAGFPTLIEWPAKPTWL